MKKRVFVVVFDIQDDTELDRVDVAYSLSTDGNLTWEGESVHVYDIHGAQAIAQALRISGADYD